MHKCIIIERGSTLDVKDDRRNPPLTNPWKWSWMEHQMKDQRLGDSVRKIQKPRFAMCLICNKEIKYGKGGCVALVEHVEKELHKKIVELRKKNTVMPDRVSL